LRFIKFSICCYLIEVTISEENPFQLKIPDIHKVKVYKRINGMGTVYYELNINKKQDVQRLINIGAIPNILKNV